MRAGAGRLAGRAAPLAGALGLWLLALAPLSQGAPLPEPKTTFEEVAAAVMSPACPGKLLLDCPSAEGAQLRELIRRKIDAGESKEQIVRYFVEVYGVEVLPNPPPEGFYLTAWLLPFAGLAAGFGVVFVMVRAWTRRPREGQGRAGPSPKDAGKAGEGEDPLEKRLRRELKEFEG